MNSSSWSHIEWLTSPSGLSLVQLSERCVQRSCQSKAGLHSFVAFNSSHHDRKRFMPLTIPNEIKGFSIGEDLRSCEWLYVATTEVPTCQQRSLIDLALFTYMHYEGGNPDLSPDATPRKRLWLCTKIRAAANRSQVSKTFYCRTTRTYRNDLICENGSFHGA